MGDLYPNISSSESAPHISRQVFVKLRRSLLRNYKGMFVTVRKQISSDVDELEKLHLVLGWIPGRDSIRPKPAIVAKKGRYLADVAARYVKESDYVLQNSDRVPYPKPAHQVGQFRAASPFKTYVLLRPASIDAGFERFVAFGRRQTGPRPVRGGKRPNSLLCSCPLQQRWRGSSPSPEVR